MRFGVISLFPELFTAFTEKGVVGRAFARNIVRLTLWNPRDYTSDTHRTVDDRPYGGGPGMLMKPEPLAKAIGAAKRAEPGSRVIYLSPQGRRFDHQLAKDTANAESIILIAGRYEGIDERIIDLYVDEEWSLGDFVLSGGEIAALAVMDSVTRLLPGVLGAAESAQQDSHINHLLDHPHFTRPVEFEGRQVPEILLSGNHEKIRRWRLQQALGITQTRRPDMLSHRELDDEEKTLLNEYLLAQTNAL